MREVLESRGIRINRNNMCSCPLHGRDNHPSMKIFKDGFNCFACGANGNVIDFVMQYEGISFKEAFVSLGGTYARQSENERKIAEIKRNRTRSERETKLKAEKDFKKELSYCIALSRKAAEVLKPLSDECFFFRNKLMNLLHAWECKYIDGEEVDEIDVIRICREVRQKISAIT